MTEQATTESPNSTFGLQDLVFTLQVYETCAQRGAFKAEEMAAVGLVYQRLRSFLESNNALAKPAATTEPTGEVQ